MVTKSFVTDTTPAIFILFLITIWPKKNPFKGHEYEHLVNWKNIQQLFPWNIILFAGGSFALAKGFEVYFSFSSINLSLKITSFICLKKNSKLSNSIGLLLQDLMPFQKELALGLIVILSEIGTEFTCNFSMSSILLPIVNSLVWLEKNHWFFFLRNG